MTHRSDGVGTKMVEKYLYTSDFLEYILNNRDLFLHDRLENV